MVNMCNNAKISNFLHKERKYIFSLKYKHVFLSTYYSIFVTQKVKK
jgi:hypothetical protein